MFSDEGYAVFFEVDDGYEYWTKSYGGKEELSFRSSPISFQDGKFVAVMKSNCSVAILQITPTNPSPREFDWLVDVDFCE